MKSLMLTIIFISLINKFSTAQFSSSDFTITTKGLSVENIKLFMDKKAELVDAFNILNISPEIKPIKVQILYEKNKGLIRIDIPYEDSSLYSSTSENMQQTATWGAYGNGVSIFM